MKKITLLFSILLFFALGCEKSNTPQSQLEQFILGEWFSPYIYTSTCNMGVVTRDTFFNITSSRMDFRDDGFIDHYFGGADTVVSTLPYYFEEDYMIWDYGQTIGMLYVEIHQLDANEVELRHLSFDVISPYDTCNSTVQAIHR